MNCVYMLRCGDGSLYTGWTNDLPRRLLAHRTGKGAKYTRSHLPVALVWYEEQPDARSAMRREWEIKHMRRAEKLALAEGGVPNMQHIPKGETAALTLAGFDEALAGALAPSPDYDVTRWLYVPNTYSEYRYILGTRGERPLIAIGINPSTAAPDALDPTLQSVERIALANGYDSFLMLNVYAQRATRPDDMEKRCNAALHAENRRAFRYLLGLSGTPAVWCAWGNIIDKRGYLMDCVRDLRDDGAAAGAAWYSAGPLLKSGHPHHPLYLRRDTRLLPFDIDAYLAGRGHKL